MISLKVDKSPGKRNRTVSIVTFKRINNVHPTRNSPSTFQITLALSLGEYIDKEITVPTTRTPLFSIVAGVCTVSNRFAFGEIDNFLIAHARCHSLVCNRSETCS